MKPEARNKMTAGLIGLIERIPFGFSRRLSLDRKEFNLTMAEVTVKVSMTRQTHVVIPVSFHHRQKVIYRTEEKIFCSQRGSSQDDRTEASSRQSEERRNPIFDENVKQHRNRFDDNQYPFKKIIRSLYSWQLRTVLDPINTSSDQVLRDAFA